MSDPASGWAAGAAREVVEHALVTGPRLDGRTLVCVDGPAGSGKTTLATVVAEEWARRTPGTVRVVHMDDLYPGWQGLRESVHLVTEDLVRPLARGVSGGYRRYDWHRGRPAEWVEVPPADLLVVEGCGSGASSYADLVTTLVWVEAPPVQRLERGLARDGEDVQGHWLAWTVDEQALFTAERTRERADLVLSTDERPRV